MKRITKKSLEKSLRLTSNGKVFIKDIEKLEQFKKLVPNEKVRFHYWTGTKRHLRVVEQIDLKLLANFCDFKKSNDGKGGVDSDYIIISTTEYNKLIKRIGYFIEIN